MSPIMACCVLRRPYLTAAIEYCCIPYRTGLEPNQLFSPQRVIFELVNFSLKTLMQPIMVNKFVPRAFPLKSEKRGKKKEWPWKEDCMMKKDTRVKTGIKVPEVCEKTRVNQALVEF